MNIIEQYDANNVYYPINCVDSNNLVNVTFVSFDDNIYKTKIDCGDGTSVNASSSASMYNKNYLTLFNGKIKIYNNPLKIKQVNINLGISNYTVDNPTGVIKNYEINPNILDYFLNCERLFFNHYCYGSNNTSIWKGKVTGEWAVKCGNKLKSLDLRNCDYPNSDPTFNLDLIPSDSVLEYLNLGNGFIVNNGLVTISGSLNNLPSSCKVALLATDKTGTNNTITGVLPNQIEEFERRGRNTITGNLNDVTSELRHLRIEGLNTLSGSLNFPQLTYLYVTGNNTITGNISNLNPNITYLLIVGNNTISGNIPGNYQNLGSLNISGSNTLTGIFPVLNGLLNCTITGMNTLTGMLNLPNVTAINIGGNNTISNLNLPEINSLTLGGQNTVSGDLTGKINPNIKSLTVSGNNTISSISGSFNSLLSFYVSGNNALTGNILSKIPNAQSITLSGQNTVNAYSTKSYPSTMNNIDLTGQAALTSAMVDQIFIDLDRDTITWNGVKRITIKGNSQPPSSASLAARSNLITNKGVTIITN